MTPEHSSPGAALTVALAMAAGMGAQVVARHLRLPGIVLLLAAGVALGPDVAALVDPGSLGSGLHVIVGFAVAVILFEGGMNLNWKRLLHEAGVIQRLVTIGALVTAAGGAVTAKLVMGWNWSMAVAFGTLVVVTGPTVVTPLLRRIRVRHRVATVLEAEGVLIDAIGAVLAVVTLQVMLIGPGMATIAEGVGALVGRLGTGLVLGATAGLVMAFLLRFRKVVPDGLENVFTLSFVLVLFQASNAWMPESGIMAVTAAGMVVGNMKTRAGRELMEFKEQLTVMLIGMLFVLLAADVRIDSIRALGWPGAITVAVLMLVVRPLNVVASTAGSTMATADRLFLCWLAPRGVVAAAIASLFSQSLSAAGIEGGDALRALVFLVIASTVLIQGLTGSLVARLLGVKRPAHHGYAILGANDLGRALGRELAAAGESVMFIDSNPAACQAAEEEGFRVVFGNVIEERTSQRAQLDDRAACIAVTPNEGINLMWVRSAVERFDIERAYLACRRDRTTVTPALVEQADASILFGQPRDLELWSLRFGRGDVVIESWVRGKAQEESVNSGFPENLLLPLLVRRKQRVRPFDSRRPPGPKDSLVLGLHADQHGRAVEWLTDNGYEQVPE